MKALTMRLKAMFRPLVLAAMIRLRGAMAALLIVATLTAGCQPPPAPPSDGGVPVVTPSGWPNTARTVINVLRWSLPAARLIVLGFVRQNPETSAVILRALDTANTTTLPGFIRALDTFERQGGDRCVVRASALALADSLVTIADTLAAAGWGLAEPLRDALGSISGIVDAVTPICVAEAGFQSHGATLRARLPSGALRPFPTISPADLDASAPAR